MSHAPSSAEFRKLYWKIENVNAKSLSKLKNKCISTDLKIVLNQTDIRTKWELQLIPYPEFWEFYVFKTLVDKEDNMLVKIEIYLKEYDEKLNFLDRIEIKSNELEERDEGYGSRLFKYENVFFENSPYIIENSLTFVIQFELHQIKLEADPCFKDNFLSSSQYLEFQNTEKYCDLIIKCSDNKDIPVHRLLIAIRSPSFAKLLDDEIIEGSSNFVKINDIDSETMSQLLQYIYTGKVGDIQQTIPSLLYAAEKFKLDKLKCICITKLADNLSVENVLHTLILADKYSQKVLEENCLGLIKMKLEELEDSDEWAKLNMRHAFKIMKSLDKNSINIYTKNIL